MNENWSKNYLLTVNNNGPHLAVHRRRHPQRNGRVWRETYRIPQCSIDVVSDHIDIYGRDDEASVTCRKLDYKDVLKLGKKAFPFARYGW